MKAFYKPTLLLGLLDDSFHQLVRSTQAEGGHAGDVLPAEVGQNPSSTIRTFGTPGRSGPVPVTGLLWAGWGGWVQR